MENPHARKNIYYKSINGTKPADEYALSSARLETMVGAVTNDRTVYNGQPFEASMNVGESLSIRELGNGAVHPRPCDSYNECLPSLITARIGNANGPRL